ncbi:hypothetical protein ACFE04_017629 [Oxalis oulophora]
MAFLILFVFDQEDCSKKKLFHKKCIIVHLAAARELQETGESVHFDILRLFANNIGHAELIALEKELKEGMVPARSARVVLFQVPLEVNIFQYAIDAHKLKEFLKLSFKSQKPSCLETGEPAISMRDHDETWIRVLVKEGGIIILPAGVDHRFTLDTNKYTELLIKFTPSILVMYNASFVMFEREATRASLQ